MRVLCCSREQGVRSALEEMSSVSQAHSELALSPDRADSRSSVALAIADKLKDKATWADCSAFFQKEYELDAYIAKMKTPIVSVLHGASSKSAGLDLLRWLD